MKKSIVVSVSPLIRLIEKKTAILEDLMTKVEELKMELDGIAHEYNVRIGSILLKDNQLDLEILQLKNLQELMKGGMTLQQATKYEEDAFYSETIRMQQEQEKLDEEKRMLSEIADVSEEVMEDIKSIWKRLIRKFHPDLITNRAEKEKREEMMKKINKAYTERNLELLQQFANMQTLDEVKELSYDQLEKSLEKIEQSILDAQGELTVLQKSTWFEWKKKKDKAKKEGLLQDVFGELEQKFLDDIVKKIEIVQKLREEVHPDGIV